MFLAQEVCQQQVRDEPEPGTGRHGGCRREGMERMRGPGWTLGAFPLSVKYTYKT